MKFVDQIRIFAKAGKGGDGCASFRREKFVPKGGPDGGDGGNGGDIILHSDTNTASLVALYYEPMIQGQKGSHGQGKGKHGRSASATHISVPAGTIIYRLPEAFHPHAPSLFEDDEEEAPLAPKPKLDTADLEVLADLSEPGVEFVLCKGGRGGKGNKHFKSSVNRAPRQFTRGAEGEEGWFFLELRTIAFAGLVGYPNAGKSTLLGSLSAAHPKVASYPFTTLHPIVGVVELPEFKRVTVADIPGLIEGAHQNRGLGHEFLRHILRCPILLYVLDMAGSEGRSPTQDFLTLQEELKLYRESLLERPFCIIANKMDLPSAEENLTVFQTTFPHLQVIPVSAANHHGLEKIRQYLDEHATD